MKHQGKILFKISLILILLLSASLSFASTVRGDLDGDGDVDRDDLNIILAARGTAASGPDDPRDLNGDGQICAGFTHFSNFMYTSSVCFRAGAF